VKDGEALVAAALQLRSDVIVTDIQCQFSTESTLPLNCDSWARAQKLYFLTVHYDQDFQLACIEASGAGFVLKSRLANDLIPALHEALAHRKFVHAAPTLTN
jgi:DNA-binding NarL/FixJ family response regulator